MEDVAQLLHLRLHRLDTVGLFDSQASKPCEVERYSEDRTGGNERLCQIGLIGKVIVHTVQHA